jgi:hypothetical protein
MRINEGTPGAMSLLTTEATRKKYNFVIEYPNEPFLCPSIVSCPSSGPMLYIFDNDVFEVSQTDSSPVTSATYDVRIEVESK